MKQAIVVRNGYSETLKPYRYTYICECSNCRRDIDYCCVCKKHFKKNERILCHHGEHFHDSNVEKLVGGFCG
jgi:lipopolysaccharide biosynthesis protein